MNTDTMRSHGQVQQDMYVQLIQHITQKHDNGYVSVTEIGSQTLWIMYL